MDINTNINRLRYFQVVCKYNNVSKAAAALNISQPSVTVAMKELEKELGVKLFDKKRNKLELTVDGQSVLQLTDVLLRDIEVFFDQVKDIGLYCHKKSRLGVPPILGTVLIPKIHEKLHTSGLDVLLEMVECVTDEAIKNLEENVIDLAILLRRDIPAGYHYQFFYETSIYFCVNRTHPLADRQYVSCEELENVPLVILSSGSFHYSAVIHMFENTGVRPNVALRSQELNTITQMVEHFGLGTFTYREVFAGNPNIVAIPCEITTPIHISAVWRKDKYINNATKALIEFLASQEWQ